MYTKMAHNKKSRCAKDGFYKVPQMCKTEVSERKQFSSEKSVQEKKKKEYIAEWSKLFT